MNAKLIPFLLLFSAILCLNASAALFAVTQPDGTNDTTSNSFSIVWTPMGAEFGGQTMLKDVNTISCYADSSTAYNTKYNLKIRFPCCDANTATVDVSTLPGRNGGQYYVWCINDQNSDMNDYSPGKFTLSRYAPGDFFGLSIDSVGGLLAGIVRNIGPVAIVIVTIIVVALITDALTGVFGIFDFLKRIAH